MNYISGMIEPLHHTEQKYQSFEEIKPMFRESINELYQYFLSEAMRKYNCKAETVSIIEKNKRK
jgi:hypothetical protein